MKKAFSLVEVIISVAIISVVIISLLNIKEQNIFIFEKLKDDLSFNSYISIAAILDVDKFDKNKTIKINDVVDFKDDKIRRSLKDIKIIVKDKKIDSKELENEFANIVIVQYKNSYELNKKKKEFYTFRFE